MHHMIANGASMAVLVQTSQSLPVSCETVFSADIIGPKFHQRANHYPFLTISIFSHPTAATFVCPFRPSMSSSSSSSSAVNPLQVFRRPKARLRDIWCPPTDDVSDSLFSSLVHGSQITAELRRVTFPTRDLSEASAMAELLRHYHESSTEILRTDCDHAFPRVFQSANHPRQTQSSPKNDFVLVPRHRLAKLEHLECFLAAESAKRKEKCTKMFLDTRVSARLPLEFVVTAVTALLTEEIFAAQRAVHAVEAWAPPPVPRHLRRLTQPRNSPPLAAAASATEGLFVSIHAERQAMQDLKAFYAQVEAFHARQRAELELRRADLRLLEVRRRLGKKGPFPRGWNPARVCRHWFGWISQ